MGISYFNSGKNRLSCSTTVPKSVPKDTGILFVHAADGNRLGPHRMFVEMATAYHKLGYPTFRFDLTGCGDSDGTQSPTDLALNLGDTINAIHYFRDRQKLASVIVFAISRGARIAFEAAVRHRLPLGGMVLLSTPLSTSQASWATFANTFKEYVQKLGSPGYLRRLMKRQVDFKGIRKTLSHALGLKHRYQPLHVVRYATTCPILFIYGGCDPIAKKAMCHFGHQCESLGVPWKCSLVTGANHSFFHYKWTQEILDVSTDWLSELEHKKL